MSGLGRLIKVERAQREGFEAWSIGRLDTAIERLEFVLAERPGAPEALLPLARAHSENDQPDRALALLEEAAATRDVQDAAHVYRALVLYDHGDLDGARNALSSLPADNNLGDALLRLLDVHDDKRSPDGFAPEQLWLADVAGRLLAILEKREGERDAAEVDRRHHRLFVPDAGKAAEASEVSAAFENERAWQQSIDKLFEAGKFDEILSAHEDRRVDDSWHDLYTGMQQGFALIVSGDAKGARRRLASLLTEHPREAELHFLLGWAEVRCGSTRRGAWSFVRAARLSDIQLHRILHAFLAPDSTDGSTSTR